MNHALALYIFLGYAEAIAETDCETSKGLTRVTRQTGNMGKPIESVYYSFKAKIRI